MTDEYMALQRSYSDPVDHPYRKDLNDERIELHFRLYLTKWQERRTKLQQAFQFRRIVMNPYMDTYIGDSPFRRRQCPIRWIIPKHMSCDRTLRTALEWHVHWHAAVYILR